MTEKLKNLLTKLEELPARQIAQMLRSKYNGLLNQMDAPYLDQHPARRVPAIISKMYEFPMTSPRLVSGATNLAIAKPGQFLLPRNNNILIGRDRSFYWCRTAIHTYVSATFNGNAGSASSLPGGSAAQVIVDQPATVGDIFSPVLEGNGGACVLNNMIRDYDANSGLVGIGAVGGNATNVNSMNMPKANSISGDFQFYDKQRGRFYSDGPVPMEFYTGGTFANKALSNSMRLDAGSEIEPRFFLKEFIMPQALASFTDAGIAPSPMRIRGYLNLVLIGYQELEHDADTSFFADLQDKD